MRSKAGELLVKLAGVVVVCVWPIYKGWSVGIANL